MSYVEKDTRAPGTPRQGRALPRRDARSANVTLAQEDKDYASAAKNWRKRQQRLHHAMDLTTGILGIFILDAMNSTPSKLEDLCSLVQKACHHSFSLEELIKGKDILPLPMLTMSAEDAKSLHVTHPCGNSKQGRGWWKQSP